MNDQPNLAALLPAQEAKQETALPPDDEGMEALGILLESVQASLQPVKDAVEKLQGVLETCRKNINRLTIENRILQSRMGMMEMLTSYLANKDPEMAKRMQAMAAATKAAEEMEKADADKEQILPNVPPKA